MTTTRDVSEATSGAPIRTLKMGMIGVGVDGAETLPLMEAAWGMAALEVSLAMIQSAKERREIPLTHQIPVPADYAADFRLPYLAGR